MERWLEGSGEGRGVKMDYGEAAREREREERESESEEEEESSTNIKACLTPFVAVFHTFSSRTLHLLSPQREVGNLRLG